MAVVGSGLVGLSLAYELACLGASVTVIDAGHPGRATDAGAGILSPATSTDTERALWPFLRQAGAHYPALLRRMESDGVDVAGAGYGRCGTLAIGLRDHEDGWFAPYADLVLRRGAGDVAEITPEEAGSLFPPSARCTASCTHPVRPGSTAGAWRPRCGWRRRRVALRSSWGRRTASWRAQQAGGTSMPSRWKGTRTWPAVR